MMKKHIHAILFLWSLSIATLAPAFGQELKSKINTAYQRFMSGGKLPNGIAALTVLDSKTGNVIFNQNGTLGLPTASTLKVITSITALDILGPEYTYKTYLSYTGEIDSLGILHGDIIVQGTGDPTLGSDRYPQSNEETVLNKWVYHIKNAGIQGVHGRIIGDDLYYNGYDMPSGWNWGDMGNYYGAGISGLNWRENSIGVVFSPRNVGEDAPISKLTHSLDFVQIVNEVKTGANGTGDNVYGYTAPYSQIIYLRGTYGKDLKKTIEISVPDPALDLAYQLKQSLMSNGISVDSLMATTAKRLSNEGIALPTNKKELDVHHSPPLKDIVYWFNQKSINLYGEALLKSIGFISGNKTETDEAARLVAKYWEQRLNIPTSELQIKDGSGLSPQNRVTSLAMSKIMNYALDRPWFTDFEKSLPTINKMSMKSGTIGGVLGYTGYQTNASGQKVTFSLLVNNYTGGTTAMRQEMFRLLDNLK